MPPVRWKLLLVAVLALNLFQVQQSISIQAHSHKQETISMTSDGWRPIVGSHQLHEPSYQITLYRNPSQISETVKAETTTSSSPSSTIKNLSSHKPSKLPPHSKHSQITQYYAMPGVLHAPHIPLGAVSVNRPPQIKKYPAIMHMALNSKRHVKPVRVQTVAHSARDEVFAPVPSTGSFSFFTQGPNTIKTRETPLGQYNLNQPHIEYANRFISPSSPTSENFFQINHPLQGFIFPKPQISNEINFQFPLNQNDDYTRNLVPPPFFNKEKTSTKKKETENPPIITKSKFPENVVVQLPPPFTNINKFSFPVTQHKDNPSVEITKEKLQVYHSNPLDYDYDFHSLKKPLINEPPKLQTYEVTESGKWTDTDFIGRIPSINHRRKPTREPDVELNLPPFLPTPYKPVPANAIIPTSPTQSEVSTVFAKLSAIQKEKNRPAFNIKEVSTHYPILGKPNFIETTPIPEISNDLTTVKEIVQIEEIITTTKEPIRSRPTRRRRPLTRKTTTEGTTVENENYDSQKMREVEEVVVKKPIRYRTTTLSNYEESDESTKSRGKNRYRHRNRVRTRPKNVESSSVNPKIIEPEVTTENYRYQQTTRKEIQEDSPEIIEVTEKHYDENTVQLTEEIATTDQVPTTNLIIPEQSEILTTPNLEIDETTTTSTTTTTETPTTTKRIRGRPIKFDNSNRPRFSVKDYRQRLNQYSSTSTTTETYPTSSESFRLRFSNRIRRPTGEPGEIRTKLKTAEEQIETERPKLKRQFSRYRTTTPSSNSTPKVSIKPNLFSNRRRPPSISLKSRIQNRNNKTEMSTTTVEIETTDSDETTTEYGKKNRIMVTNIPENNEETTTDILKNEAFMYSQRVSDLTSSSKNEYNTPGLFKSLSPVSRRIPNYFTLATEDPILPIEAFFPNIKDKDKE